MFKKIISKRLILIIAMLFFLVTIIAIILLLLSGNEGNVKGANNGLANSPLNPAAHESTTEIYNYNFSVNLVVNDRISSLLNQGSVAGSQSTFNEPIQADQANANTNSQQANKIVIEKLGVNIPILYGTDGESAIHQGAWMYPSSYDGNGEKIVLGHRRYWGPDHPYSFWYLNTLTSGDIIKYYDKSGQLHTYVVKNISIHNGNDTAILEASEQDLLTLISCSTVSGNAGSAEKRIVVTAAATTRT